MRAQAGTTDSWTATARRKSARVRRNDQRARTARVAVVLSLFLVLVVAALLVGGRAVLDPLLQAAEAGETGRAGDVVYAMPDGTFCRHMSFDNTTAELTEGTIVPCAEESHKDRPRSRTGFTWGTR